MRKIYYFNSGEGEFLFLLNSDNASNPYFRISANYGFSILL